MSQYGGISDALEVIWRASVSEVAPLAAGLDGYERVLRSGRDAGARPKVYAFNPAANRRPLDGGGLEGTVTWAFEFWGDRSATQEQLALDLDRFRAGVEADPTLGGLGIRSWVSFDGIRDGQGAGQDDRVANVIVSTVVEE